ncbi:hypothetical protein [Streptomyces sp. NBC_01304]|uniref:hypothetical protein n=1 Tax=Streptomyces sp. NBC_01304 TaxID=2903818 RepID=UPI002E14F263|nr:hypothetical protein OG430_25490 [Streptomyces sp. NBC_01304]
MSRAIADTPEAEYELRNWIFDMPEVLREMRAEVLDEDFPFDFGVATLDALEAHMLDEFPSASDTVSMDFRPTRCAMAYLGEVLLSIAGGQWGWNRREVRGSARGRPGHPVICPDPALGLKPTAPLLLITYARAHRTGGAFAWEAERLRRAVADLKEQDPDWEPATVLHPAEAERRSGTDHPDLLRWLDERARAFPAWAEEAGAPKQWDFGPDTLDLLEDVVRGRFADDESVDAAKGSPFVQGAVWYIGETVRRHRDGVVWQYQPGTPYTKAEDAVLFGPGEFGVFNTPLLGQPGLREGNRAYPLGILNTLYWEFDDIDEPLDDHIRDLLDDWA